MATGSETRHYDVHGALTIAVKGAHTPTGEVVHADLARFACGPVDRPDLAIVLGEAPDDLARRGRSLGHDLWIDDEAKRLLVMTPSMTGTNGTAAVKYVVVGDVRTPTHSVSAYVPNLVTPRSRGQRARRALRGRFSSRVATQANDLMANIVEPFLYYRLVGRGRSLLHAAAVSNGGGTVLFGPSAVGKTRLTLGLVESGAAFLGDDLVMVDESGSVLCFPKRVRLPFRDIAAHPKVARRLGARMPGLHGFAFRRHVDRGDYGPDEANVRFDISDLFDGVAVLDSCDPERVIHLTRGPGDRVELREIGPEVAVKRLVSNAAWEFTTPTWRARPVLLGFSFAADRDFLAEEVRHQERIERVIAGALANVPAYELALPESFDAHTFERAVDTVRSIA